MEFLVTASGNDPFYFNMITPAPSQEKSCVRPAEQPCAPLSETGKCRLVRTVDPILEYFSAVTSYETVEARYHEDNEQALLRETGQRVAFVLLVRTMFQSKCPYFARFSPLLSRYHLARTQEMFLLASLMASQPDGEGNDTPPRCPLGSGLQEHLFSLLREARHLLVRDAAVNAVTIMLHLAALAAEDAAYSQALALPSLATIPLPPAILPPTGA